MIISEEVKGIDYEGELAVVVGREVAEVEASETLGYALGY